VLQWCRDNDWIMYISPPHTTGIHQSLDQIFKSWHDTFNIIVARWADQNTGKELNKRIFTDMFAEAWGKWCTPVNIVAAFRRVGLSVSGVNPSAVPESKFVLASSVARPNPAPAPAAALMPPPATPALMGPRTRSGETSAGETSAAGSSAPAPDSKEYWMAKSKLVSEAARDLFAAGRKMHERPLTLKATHPAWQVKKAEATHEDPAQVARVRRAAERLGLGRRARGLRARKSCPPGRARR